MKNKARGSNTVELTKVLHWTAGFNPHKNKHPSSEEKMIQLDVEAYLSPITTVFITCEGVRVYSLYFRGLLGFLGDI